MKEKSGSLLGILPVLIIVALISQCGHNKKINSVSFSPNSDYIIAATNDKSILVFNGKTGNKEYDIVGAHSQHSSTGSSAKVNTVAFRPDGKQFLSGGNDSAILIWDTHLLNYINDPVQMSIISGYQRRYQGGIVVNRGWYWTLDAEYSKNGRQIVSGHKDKTVRVWKIISKNENIMSDSYSMELITQCSGHKKEVTSVSINTNGTIIVSGSKDKTLKLWNYTDGMEIMTLVGHKGSINDVCFSIDGKYIISASDDKTIKIWDSKSGIELETLTGHKGKILALACSPDGRYLVSGGTDRAIKIWDMSNWEEIKTFSNNKDWITSLSFSLSGDFVAGLGNRTISIYRYNEFQ
jgi:WD40 repeat protein